MKHISISSFFPDLATHHHHHHRGRAAEKAAKPQTRNQTSAAEAKPPKAAKAAETICGKQVEDIDQCADAFIKRFRKQLLIQRMESIENYQQMLARGT